MSNVVQHIDHPALVDLRGISRDGDVDEQKQSYRCAPGWSSMWWEKSGQRLRGEDVQEGEDWVEEADLFVGN